MDVLLLLQPCSLFPPVLTHMLWQGREGPNAAPINYYKTCNGVSPWPWGRIIIERTNMREKYVVHAGIVRSGSSLFVGNDFAPSGSGVGTTKSTNLRDPGPFILRAVGMIVGRSVHRFDVCMCV